MPAPENVATLIGLLGDWALKIPGRAAYTFLDHSRTFGELWREINQFATLLNNLEIERHDRVLVALPNGLEFFPAFYGIQRAGAIPVPIFPGFNSDRFLAMAALCGARLVVVPSDTPTTELDQLSRQAAGSGLKPISVAQAVDSLPAMVFPQIEPDDVAFIQYTSGSTGNPKGVQLSHRNLLTNIQQMINGMEVTDQDIFVSWLPLYHDMGLILKTMMPFYLAAQLHLLPAKLTSVRLWLESIDTRRGTFTAAPDFAYRLAVRRISKPEGYDLSSLRVALNAAEPVRARTIREFEAKFGLKDVMAAAYGLAEATVFVSVWGPSMPPKVDKRGFVSVGRQIPGINITIWEGNRMLAPNEVGEVVIDSPANSRGYFNNPRATEELWCEAGVRSGDLGYLDEEGYLFIAGRKKNSIIHAGQTVYPREIEEVVGVVEGVRMAAAVGVDRGGLEGEQVTIFAEIQRARSKSEQDREEMVVEIVGRFYDRFGFRPGRVYLVKPRTIPQTANGKLQHQRLKGRFEGGELHQEGLILFPHD